MKPRVLRFAEYLDAVQRIHGAENEEIAATAAVSKGEVWKWRRGIRTPSLGVVEKLVTRYGGDARLVYLGVVLERFSRQTGCTLEEAAGLPYSRRSATPVRKPRIDAAPDRRQLSFLPESR